MPSKPRQRALAKYDAKRDFTITSEPRGGRAAKSRTRQLAFVVQMHDATRLHYDFRLEHEGVLWSWAIPKGPSLDPKDRRLAARTEDHPFAYRTFEGNIPEGEYGGGPVIVWDRGTWQPEGDAAAGMKKGHLKFTLDGEKLSGAFHLVRLKPKGNEKESWLFFKSKDEAARPGSDIVREQPDSVASGRSIADIRAGVTKPTKTKTKTKTKTTPTSSSIADALTSMNLGFAITSPDKVLYPEAGITKADVMGYLAWVAPRMLPFARNRPLMFLRCPEGRAGQCFYQKHASKGLPASIHHVRIPEKTSRGDSLYLEDAAGLIALGQMGVLEIHTWMCSVDRPERPDQIVLDIDPDPSVTFAKVIETALALRDVLRRVGVTSFVKTTGGKGLHVVAPLAPDRDWAAHELAARTLVESVARTHPDRYVTTMSKAARRGKIFLDYLRNGRGATAVAPYSLRARDDAPIAMPVTWEALGEGFDPRAFTLREVIGRGAPRSDPWRGYDDHARQSIDLAALAKL